MMGKQKDAFFAPNRIRTSSQDRRADEFERAAKRGREHVYGDHLAAWGDLIFRDEAGVFTVDLVKFPG